MGRALLVVAPALALLALAFVGGRQTAPRGHAPARQSYDAGYRAGRDAAFGNYDGGWGYGDFWIVTLRPGGPGITYRLARRWPMLAGVDYRVCGGRLCSRRGAPAR